MKLQRSRVAVLAGIWALFGALMAVAVVSNSTSSGHPLAVGAMVLGVGASIGAAFADATGHRRYAGALLMVSAVIPTSFAYLPNVVAFLGGLWLAVRSSRPASVHL